MGIYDHAGPPTSAPSMRPTYLLLAQTAGIRLRHLQVFWLLDLVPWMLVFGPDGALYVSVDKQYEAATSYGNPAEYDSTGCVLRVNVLPDGK
jgi:hypothetical protein